MEDKELEAMKVVFSALTDLDAAARGRVMRWVGERLDLPVATPGGDTERGVSGHRQFEAAGLAPTNVAKFDVSLASYIRAKNASNSQALRFLVTADWLRRRGQALTSGAIAKALMDNQQARLANPFDCLNRNVAKGFCEKTKDGFFITPEGLKQLGHTE